jgi:O-antigen/teichoic acid export membrane protein
MMDGDAATETTSQNQQVRHRRLRYAFVTGMLSKLLAVAVQWVALPLALKALGTDRYAAFLALQALVAWSNLLALGLAPSLPRFISDAYVAGQRERERDIFQSTVFYLTGVCALFAVAMLSLAQLLPPSQMVATRHVSPEEIVAGYRTVVLLTAAQLVTSIMPSIRGGYQELHYSYLWAGLASLLVMTGLYYVAGHQPSVAAFLIVIYGPLVLAMLSDAALICIQRPYLLRGCGDLRRTGKILAPQATNALAGQFAYFLVSFVPTLIVAHLSGAMATAAFGSIMQLMILLGSGMNLIYQPLVPAIANAYAHHDRTWVRKAYYRAASLVIAICGIGLLIDFAAGSIILHSWLGSQIEIPPALPIVLGLYFTMWMVNVLHFNILAATGNLNLVGKAYLAEGALSIALGLALTHRFGATGMAVGLAVGTACVNFWFLPLQVRRHVVNHDWTADKAV